MKPKRALVVIGVTGRMGSAIVAAAGGDWQVVAGVAARARADGPVPVFEDLDAALERVPEAVVVSVAVAQGEAARIARVAETGHPLVEGTTGLETAAEDALRRAAERVAVVRAPNFSPGMTILRRLVRTAVRARGVDWDVAVIDRHHRAKRDAPSGTARDLDALLRGEGREPQVASLRQGGVVGEHAVYLSGGEEEIVLTHRAFHRRVFARGALLAAAFAASAPPGLYGMDEVLGLDRGS